MKITLELPPEARRQYTDDLASPVQQRLARALQRAALAHSQAVPDGDFVPAPLYIRQALALTSPDGPGGQIVGLILAKLGEEERARNRQALADWAERRIREIDNG